MSCKHVRAPFYLLKLYSLLEIPVPGEVLSDGEPDLPKRLFEPHTGPGSAGLQRNEILWRCKCSSEQCELWTDTAPFPQASVRGSTRPQPVYTHLVRGVAVEECGCPQEHSPPCGKRTTTRWQHTRHSRRESPVGRLVFGQNMLFRTLGGSSGEKNKRRD